MLWRKIKQGRGISRRREGDIVDLIRMARANTTDWVLFEKENKKCER